MPGVTGGVIYIINKKSATESVQPYSATNTFTDTELCKENYYSTLTNNGTGVPCTSVPSGTTWYTTVNSYSPFTGTSAALDYKWVRIALKGNSSSFPYYVNGSNALATAATQVCNAGGTQALLPTGQASCTAAGMQPVYVITSLAVTPRGTRRMVQAEISKVTVNLPPFPGAITLNGPGGVGVPPYDAPNSNPFHVNGNNATGCPGANVPAIATIDSATQTRVINAIPSNRRDHNTGVDGTQPDVAALTNLPSVWQSAAQIEALANGLKAIADPANVYTGAQSNINIGSHSTPQITYVDGALTMTGTTRGGGILIVTGTLTMSGNSGFYGIVLCIGKGVFQANGGGNGQYDGTIMIAHTRDNNGNVLTSLGNPVMDWSGGGGNGVYYNTCAIQAAMNLGGGSYVSMVNRELWY
jgi:hypothetical protein